MRLAAKVDQNQMELIDAFRRFGFTVLSLAGVGFGVPDLLVARGQQSCLVEIKFEKGKLRASQENFAKAWNGRIEVARTVDDVVRIANNWTAKEMK